MVEITRINDEPYSEQLVSDIATRKSEFLRDAMALSCMEPYNFASTGDRLTIRFDRDDLPEKGVDLPFQTNYTVVSNMTDYHNLPKWNFLKNFWIGKLQRVHPKRLDEFLEFLEAGSNRFDTMRCAHMVERQGKDDQTGRDSITFRNDRIETRYKSTPEDFDSLKSDFICVPEPDFTIDPRSDLRIEERTLKDGRRLYVASLSIEKFRGLSGVPPITYQINQKIKAEETKK